MTAPATQIPSLPLTGAPSQRAVRRAALAFVVTVAAAIALAVGFGLGYGHAHDGRFMAGVHVAGVDVSGLDRDQAAARLRADLPSLSSGSLTVAAAGERRSIPFADLGRDYDLDAMLQPAFQVGRTGDASGQVADQMQALTRGAVFPTLVRFDREALARELEAAAAGFSVAPRDASVSLVDGRFVVTESSVGRHVEPDSVTAAAEAALIAADPADISLELAVSPVSPAVATETVLPAMAAAHAMTAADLTLSLDDGTTFSIPSATLREWVSLGATADGRYDATLMPGAIPTEVARLGEAVSRPAVDATVAAADDGGRFVVTAARPGRALDVPTTSQRIAEALAARRSSGAGPVAVATFVVAPALSTEHAQAAASEAERLAGSDVVLTAGSDEYRIGASALRTWVVFGQGADGAQTASIPVGPVLAAVEDAAEELDRDAVDARFAFASASSEDVTVAPARDGRRVDVARSVAAVLDAVSRPRTGTSRLALTVTAVAPDVTTAEVQAAASRVTRISEWTTKYPVGPNNGFGANIQIPARILNGHVVQPGETFDFWREIGGISRELGYKPGAMIQGGTTVEPGEIGSDGKPVEGALGGGICSASTTLFNAALRAGFPIGDRRNHYYYISRYPLGLDATVWRNGERIQTMEFTNDTDWPVLIRGINKEGSVTFQLYSVAVGRTVTLDDPVVTGTEEASDSIVFTKHMAPGTTRRAEKPHDGMRISVTRTVRDADGKLIRRDKFTSRYGTVRGVLLVGGEGEDIIFEPGTPARWPVRG